MDLIYVPIPWTSVADFVESCYEMLDSICFTLPNQGYFTLWDVLCYSAILGGIGALIATYMNGSYTND